MANFDDFIHTKLHKNQYGVYNSKTNRDSRNFQQTALVQYSRPHQPKLRTVLSVGLYLAQEDDHTRLTCRASLSASLYTATVLIPNFFAVRVTRQAISPLGRKFLQEHSNSFKHAYRFAIKTLLKCGLRDRRELPWTMN